MSHYKSSYGKRIVMLPTGQAIPDLEIDSVVNQEAYTSFICRAESWII